jgi:hypothetical protein
MKKALLASLLSLGLISLAWSQPQLSGDLSGNLGPGTYLVVGDVQVPSGQTLTIAPGTTFLHNGYRWWRIYGTLQAVGTPADSIKWLRRSPVPENRWSGLRFQQGAPSNSLISYCVVEYGYVQYPAGAADMGGCIFSYGVPLTITHSRVSYGESLWGGGGICGYNVNGMVISYNLICDNKDTQWKGGGGILFNSCTNSTITHNDVCRNSSTSS